MLSSPPGAKEPELISHRHNVLAMIFFVTIVAAIWIALFQLNTWLFSDAKVSGYISWVFLPAAIRMLAVMIGGWAGAFGLFVGALVTNIAFIEYEPLNVVTLAALSSVGPLLAAYLCTRWLRLPKDLSGLHRSQLLVFAVAGAIFNVFPHNMYFYLIGMSSDAWSGVVPMFVGDLLGTLAVLYLASILIRLFSKGLGIKKA